VPQSLSLCVDAIQKGNGLGGGPDMDVKKTEVALEPFLPEDHPDKKPGGNAVDNSPHDEEGVDDERGHVPREIPRGVGVVPNQEGPNHQAGADLLELLGELVRVISDPLVSTLPGGGIRHKLVTRGEVGGGGETSP